MTAIGIDGSLQDVFAMTAGSATGAASSTSHDVLSEPSHGLRSTIGLSSSAGSRQGRSLLDIGPLEADVLSVVWARQEVTVRAVHDELRLSRRIAYTTVLTVLTNLTQKGFVLQDRTNTAYLYRAAVSREQVIAAIVDVLVDSLLAGDPKPLADYVTSRMQGSNDVS